MAIAMFIMVAKLNHVIEYCFVGLLVFWIGVKIRNRDFHFVKTSLDLPIVLFVSWILVTIPFAVDPSYSFAEWRKTLLQILMFYFVVNVVKKEKQVLKATQNWGGNRTTFLWDNSGNRKAVINALGDRMTYSFNSSNHLTSVLDPRSNRRTKIEDSVLTTFIFDKSIQLNIMLT